MAKSVNWMHGGKGDSNSQKKRKQDFGKSTQKWIKYRSDRQKIQKCVNEEFSPERWAKILQAIQHVFKDASDVEFDVRPLLEFLTDYINDGEEWAEKIYMEVGGNERQRLLNQISGINDTMKGVGDLLAKKNLQLQIDEYNERIQEIENGMLQITKK
jgi:hypothetical protein